MLCLHLFPILARPQGRFPLGGQISGIQNGGQKTTVLFKCHPFRDFICHSVCDLLYLTGFFMAHSCTKHQTKYTGKAWKKKDCTVRIESLRCCRARFNKAQWSQKIFPKETHPKNNTSCNVEARLNFLPPGPLLVLPTAKLWHKHPQRQTSTGQGTSKWTQPDKFITWDEGCQGKNFQNSHLVTEKEGWEHVLIARITYMRHGMLFHSFHASSVVSH